MRQHLLRNPFVLFTSIAALIHSTWALSTMFGGHEPELAQATFAWIGWAVPGLLLAASIDVGLLSTALAVEGGDHSVPRMITFVVLALSMFLLQFFYTISHFPSIDLSSGVREDWVGAFKFVRDGMIVVGPLLLPTAITLHTFANTKHKSAEVAAPTEVQRALIVRRQPLMIETGATCPHCGWERSYSTPVLAQRALRMHLESCKLALSENSEV